MITELQKLPVLPLRDIVVFPHMAVPLFVGREKSIKALEEVMKKEKKILLLTQKDSATEDPKTDELNHTGCIATILQLLKLPDGTVRVLVEGVTRAAVDDFTAKSEYYEANVAALENEGNKTAKAKTLSRSVYDQFEEYVKLNKKIAEDIVTAVANINNPAKLADTISVHLAVKIPEKQKLLAETNVAARLETIFELLDGEISVMKVEKKIRGRVKRQMEKTQREYYLNEQMKAIQTELGGGKEENDEISELDEKIKETKFSKEARTKAEAELKKLGQMSPMSAEANVSRNYLDWLLSVPWNKKKRVRKDLSAAQKILDDDHYGLEKVKERIVEHLAVQTRTKKLKGPILCLVGPQVWVKRPWDVQSPMQRVESLCAYLLVVCAMKAKFVDIGGPILDQCRAGLSSP